jgi:hypothetical protein
MTAAVLCQTVRRASYDSELEHNNCDLADFEESRGRMQELLKSRFHSKPPMSVIEIFRQFTPWNLPNLLSFIDLPYLQNSA